jgi:hypothetical protein
MKLEAVLFFFHSLECGASGRDKLRLDFRGPGYIRYHMISELGPQAEPGLRVPKTRHYRKPKRGLQFYRRGCIASPEEIDVKYFLIRLHHHRGSQAHFNQIIQASNY